MAEWTSRTRRSGSSGDVTQAAGPGSAIDEWTRRHPGDGAALEGTVPWVWSSDCWGRSVPARYRARLHATAGLLRDLTVTGADGLQEAREHRRELIAAAKTTGDTELAARIIGSYDVPAIWTRADDPAHAGELVRIAARAAARLGSGGPPVLRARLLSVVAVESRGDAAADAPLPRAAAASVAEPWRLRAERAAEEAVRLARRLGDPAVLAFALNGAFMHSFATCGSAAHRDALGAELTRLAVDHQLPGHEVLGRLVRVQALAGLGGLAAADAEAEEIDRLAHRDEQPLAAVLTSWYRALRTCETDGWTAARPQYAKLLAETEGHGMPGLTRERPSSSRSSRSCGTTPCPTPTTSPASTPALTGRGSSPCCWPPRRHRTSPAGTQNGSPATPRPSPGGALVRTGSHRRGRGAPGGSAPCP